MLVAFPPPKTIREPITRSLTGLFFFLFQRGLAIATALQRLAKCAKLVSEPALSLTERPSTSEGRIQKVMHFQCVDVFGQAPFSKSQTVALSVANPRDGRRAVDIGGAVIRCGKHQGERVDEADPRRFASNDPSYRPALISTHEPIGASRWI